MGHLTRILGSNLGQVNVGVLDGVLDVAAK